MKKLLLLAGLFGTLFRVAAPAQIIDTTPTWDGISGVSAFGEGSATPTFGQMFKAPTGFTALDSFTFWLKSQNGPDGVDFSAYVMEWHGPEFVSVGRVTGPILYQSGPQVFPFGTSTMTPVTFATGGLVLDSSKQYVAFLSMANFNDGLAGNATIGYVYSGVIPGGGFRFNNDAGYNFNQLSATNWLPFIGTGTDAAFRATFRQLPQELSPSPLVMV